LGLITTFEGFICYCWFKISKGEVEGVEFVGVALEEDV
jgi:hypothetical protein